MRLEPTTRWVAGIFTAVALIGCFLPWARLNAGFIAIDVNGTDGDAWLLVAAAVAVSGLAIWQDWWIVHTAAMVGSFGIGVWKWVQVRDLADDALMDDVLVQVGIGLIAITICSAAAAGLGIAWGYQRSEGPAVAGAPREQSYAAWAATQGRQPSGPGQSQWGPPAPPPGS